MTRYYTRRTPGWRETAKAALVAGGVAAAVAAVTFYVVRLTLSREPLERKALPTPSSEASGGEAVKGSAKGALPEVRAKARKG